VPLIANLWLCYMPASQEVIDAVSCAAVSTSRAVAAAGGVATQAVARTAAAAVDVTTVAAVAATTAAKTTAGRLSSAVAAVGVEVDHVKGGRRAGRRSNEEENGQEMAVVSEKETGDLERGDGHTT
jgi:hypothetical protein